MNLIKLPTFKHRDERIIRCVVESPAGSPSKLKYDPEVKAFELSHPLLKGLTYPFDWGFIPSTRGLDDDPLDVMLIHDAPTVPGLIVPSLVIGVLEMLQSEKGGKPFRNDRIFAVPVKSHREDDIKDVDDMSKRMRQELERFFMATASLEDKKLEFLGWKGPKAAERLVEEGCAAFKKADGK
jgi:inorganic pyrophosphatase